MSTVDIQGRIQMREIALRAQQAEYSDLWESWKVVESKAQPIAALAGVFLAGVFTYLGQLPPSATDWEKYLLCAIAVLLVGCAVCALFAIRVKDVSSPYLSSVDVDEVDDILRASTTEKDLSLRRERMVQGEVSRWKLACISIRRDLRIKQQLLNLCLLLLGLGSLAAAILACVTLFTRGAA